MLSSDVIECRLRKKCQFHPFTIQSATQKSVILILSSRLRAQMISVNKDTVGSSSIQGSVGGDSTD